MMTPNATAVAQPPLPDTAALAGTAAQDLCVVVAPGNGRFQPAVADGAVAAGDVIGHLTTGGGRRKDVHSPAAVFIRGLLVRPGHLVTTGQALVWATRVCAA